MHLAKHPGQKVSALTLSIAAREGESNDAPGAYRAKITALVRDKQVTFSNLDGARCVDQGATLACFTDGFFLGRFAIERAGKNRKLALRNEGEHLALVPASISAPLSCCHRKIRGTPYSCSIKQRRKTAQGNAPYLLEIASPTMLTVMAIKVTLKTNETTLWISTMWRSGFDVTTMSATCDAMPMPKAK